MDNKELSRLSYQLRKDILDMIYRAKAGHIGGDFSVIDILINLYFKQMNVSNENFKNPDHDRFILSKGHSVEALYAVLAAKGFYDKKELETVGEFNTRFLGHPTTAVNGVEINSGSLGHGLSVGVGMALLGKRENKDFRVHVVMGDGEMAEGSIWEAIMSASHFKLDNLVAVVDRNGLQISGTTEEVMSQDLQEERWASFGWNVVTANGNDHESLNKAFTKAKETNGSPTVIVAHTIKGFGVSIMENQIGWHHRVPTDEEFELATKELKAKEAAL